MNTNDVICSWVEDSPINSLDLGQSAMDIHKLHAKYINMWSNAKRDLFNARAKLKQLKFDKKEFLLNPTKKQMDLGWEIPDRKVIKTEINDYLLGDPHIQKMEALVAECENSYEMLQDILKQITNRNWLIQSAIRDRAFLNGD